MIKLPLFSHVSFIQHGYMYYAAFYSEVDLYEMQISFTMIVIIISMFQSMIFNLLPKNE